MTEKFIILPFDAKYAVSNFGNIKNIKNNKSIKKHINRNGYEEVQLCTDGIKKNYRIHRLVALMFIDNQYNKPYVNHIDGDKTNNNVNNLEWVTAKENDSHARLNDLKKQNKPIKMINIDDENDIVIFESLSECSRFLNVNKSLIHRVLKGKRNKVKNYYFKYI